MESDHISRQFEHIQMLQVRNKIIRESQKPKNARQISLEKREQGFALYLNGANTVMNKTSPQNNACFSNNTVTTGCVNADSDGSVPVGKTLEYSRSKTPRATWSGVEEMPLKTLTGRSFIVGNREDEADYEDDFDDDEESSDIDIRDHLLLTLSDVKALRQSLEASNMTLNTGNVNIEDNEIDVCDDIEEECNEAIITNDDDDTPLQSFQQPSSKSTKLLGMIRTVNAREVQSKPQTREVEFKPPMTKSVSRPISGVKRKDIINVESKVSADVIKAIEEENNRVDSARRNDNLLPKEVPKSTETVSSKPPVNNNNNLNEETLETLVNRIRHLDIRHQQLLISLLDDIDTNYDVSPDTRRSLNSNLTRISSPKNTKESLETTSYINLQNETLFYTVSIELTSNWGDSNRIGLTAIELFDQDYKPIIIDTDLLYTSNAFGLNESVYVLFDGACKTIESKHMLSCKLSGNSVFVCIPIGGRCSFVRLWNFNDPNCLDVGANIVRVLVNDAVRWEGRLPRGCGNQRDDYSLSINIGDEVGHKVFASKCLLDSDHSHQEDNILQQVDDDLSPLQPFGHGSDQLEGVDSSRPDGTPRSPKPRPRRSSRGQIAARLDGLSRSVAAVASSDGTGGMSDSDLNAPVDGPSRVGVSASISCPTRTITKSLLLENDSSFSQVGSLEEPPMIHQLNLKLQEGDPSAPDTPLPLVTETPLVTGDTPSWYRELIVDTSRRHEEASCCDSLDLESWPHRESRHHQGGGRRVAGVDPLEESWRLVDKFNRSQVGRLGNAADLDEVLGEVGVEARGVEASSSGEFIIPELPVGRLLSLHIATTWGDRHYLGLNGIEVFSASGAPVRIDSVSADPADINVLPEYSADPRVAANLVDGVYRTSDDCHLWLTPFTPGRDHTVRVRFTEPARVAMVRVWNYAKSRAHSYRGARRAEIRLDGVPVFVGEIARAGSRDDDGVEQFGDTILFTVDDEVLSAISRFDETYEVVSEEERVTEEPRRPLTADLQMESSNKRPFTSAFNRETIVGDGKSSKLDDSLPRGSTLRLNFTATWGDVHYLGLTGLEVVDADSGVPIPLSAAALAAEPADLRHLPGCAADDRTLDKLVDGTNRTTNDVHMWLVPFRGEGSTHELLVSLGRPRRLAGIRVWNYNKSAEDTNRGARVVHVELDGVALSPPNGFLLRRSPGNADFDFAQEVVFSEQQNVMDECSRIRRPGLPCGFIFRIALSSTWGDLYYVGLNGIALYNEDGVDVAATRGRVFANPPSVNALEGVEGDVRTADRLTDGVNDASSGRHSWLAPLLPGVATAVYVVFDAPVTATSVRLWNYSKTPSRGVRGFAILVDGFLVHNGSMDPYRPASGIGILPGLVSDSVSYHEVNFAEVVKDDSNEEHDVRLNTLVMRDNLVIKQHDDPSVAKPKTVADQSLRPMTSLTTNRASWQRPHGKKKFN